MKSERLEILKEHRATLKDILPEFAGKHIRVGFLHGSGFVYCNMVTEDTVKEIRKEQDEILSEMGKIVVLLSNDLKRMWQIGLAGYITKEVNRERKAYQFKTAGRGREFIPSSADEIETKYRKKIDYMEKYIERWGYLTSKRDFILGAQYLTSYPSIDPEALGTYIIILDGDIQGKYWNEKEYLTRFVDMGKEDDTDGMD